MVNFGYPYNDIVICKDSTDYLLVNDQLVINCNDSRHSCLMLIIVLYISKPGYQLPVSKLSVCLRSAVNV